MLSSKSLQRLAGVDIRLQAVIGAAAAICPVDFQVTEGVRSKERQAFLVWSGKSKTLNSEHLTGRAVDVVVMIDGREDWTMKNYATVAASVKKAAAQLGIAVEWGGDWKNFPDGPHFQLKRNT